MASARASASQLPDTFEPLERRSARSAVTDYVRRLIFDDTLREGDRVPQGAIAAKLGLSRIPVREGLVALEREGIITIQPHRGAFVNRFDEDAIRDHYELYGLIHGHAARRAAERLSDEHLEELRQACDAIDAARDAREMLASAAAFRDGLIHAGGSPCFSGLMRSLTGIVPGNFFFTVPESIPVAKRGFRAILSAIEAGNGEEAAACCAEMMRAHGLNVNRVRAQSIAKQGEAPRG